MSSEGNTMRVLTARAQDRVLGRRFCTACQAMKVPDGGIDKPMRGGRSKRFVCAGCVARWKSRSKA